MWKVGWWSSCAAIRHLGDSADYVLVHYEERVLMMGMCYSPISRLFINQRSKLHVISSLAGVGKFLVPNAYNPEACLTLVWLSKEGEYKDDKTMYQHTIPTTTPQATQTPYPAAKVLAIPPPASPHTYLSDSPVLSATNHLYHP